MRMSQMFGKTLRDDPSDADTAGHRLLIRAGLVAQVAAGVYSYLPMALRSMRKIENIIREEMNAAGAQEVLMPVIQPVELWRQSGREEAFGPTLLHLNDRRERQMVLAPTHEEAVTDLARRHVRSYRDLPINLYQIQTKLRDEARPRAGLIRVREFHMKDAYSFDTDQDGLDVAYDKMVQAYWNIFRRSGLDVVAVEADSGAMGGSDSQEYMLLADTGEDELVNCPACGYAANVERARSRYAPAPDTGEPNDIEIIDTPNMTTIAELAEFLSIEESQTLKAVFYVHDGEFIFVAIRGDLDVNEVKLANALGGGELRLASDEEVKAAGIVAGSASPVGIDNVRKLGDLSATQGANYVAGANDAQKHFRNVNHGRDFQLDDVIDIAKAEEGHGCPRCDEGTLNFSRGIEVGHVFKLGTKFSEAFSANYVTQDGEEKPMFMGCYGIGVGRLLGAAIESRHDDEGIIFPASIAPYDIHLVSLNPGDEEIASAADEVYNSLTSAGLEVLFDDRDESAGIKFSDADLLGMPLRVTVSRRSMRDGRNAELKLRSRDRDSATIVPIVNAVQEARGLLNELSGAN
ncbi:MAG: proline--tRNA ligase [Chloroflexi bacterium]|nr:proline--tRNA ligase [Chloroflexota bacterium]